MEIIPVIPRGYCKGVTQAIALARKTARENPGVPITMLGMIVHNRYVVDALQLDHIRCVEQAGKTRLELLDEIWGMDSESDDKTVNVHINRLRTRFYDWPEFEIQTIRGIGYRAIKKV